MHVYIPSDWSDTPPLVSFEEACFLSGHGEETMEFIIRDGGVDTEIVDGQRMITTASLQEYQECLWWVLHCWETADAEEASRQ